MAARQRPRLTTLTTVPAADADSAQRSLLLAQQALTEAVCTGDPLRRYACAHVAALRAAAAVLAVRARPTGRPGQRNAWELLVRVAPELSEWAALFAACARKRSAAEAGLRDAVTTREADDQVRDAERFLSVVERTVGAPAHLPLESRLRWTSPEREAG